MPDGSVVWTSSTTRSGLKKKGLVASFYTDDYRKGFVTAEMVEEIKKAVERARFREVWGKEVPEGMLSN